MTNMTDSEFADALVRARREYAVIGACIGGLYQQLKFNGVPDEETHYLTGSLFDRLLDLHLKTEVTIDPKAQKEAFEAFLHPKT